MATTTNYGWTTPDDTALVKDGASAIRTLGSSVDTTVKALNPETTLGDISYRSSTANTKTRLAIGSEGQYLTVSSGVPAWSNISAGGMTSLASGTLSGAEVSLTSISQSYVDLLLLIRNPYVNSANAPAIRVNSNSGSYRYISWTTANTTLSNTSGDGIRIGDGTSQPTSASNWSWWIYIRDYTSTNYKTFNYAMVTDTNQYAGIGTAPVTAAITSVQIRCNNGTSTYSGGTYVLYGVK